MPNESSFASIRGLSEADAQTRLKTEGYNELPKSDRRTPLRIILEVVREPMLALLLGGGAASVAMWQVLHGAFGMHVEGAQGNPNWLGLVLAEIGEKNNITVADDELSRAVMDRARQFAGQEQRVWDYYRQNPQAVAALRAPIFEEKVVDFLLELASVKDSKVSREELYKDDESTS